jgi:hypothetical protein
VWLPVERSAIVSIGIACFSLRFGDIPILRRSEVAHITRSVCQRNVLFLAKRMMSAQRHAS